MKNHVPRLRQDLFGLSAIPFQHAPAKPYLDPARQDQLDTLRDFLHYRGYAVISGKPGSGKTTLAHHLCQQLPPGNHRVMYAACGNFTSADLLATLSHQLDLTPLRGRAKNLQAIDKRLSELGARNPVLVLDEMQLAPPSILDLLRLAATSSFDHQRRMSVILIGTEPFLNQLQLAINESLRQRVHCYCRLGSFSADQTAAYIVHHLQQAGAHQDIFLADAINLLHQLSSGLPRIIDTLALSALTAASEGESQIVTLDHVHQAKTRCLLPAVLTP